jgi:hypothetical protein
MGSSLRGKGGIIPQDDTSATNDLHMDDEFIYQLAL